MDAFLKARLRALLKGGNLLRLKKCLEALKLFNEKAQKLANYRFTKIMFGQKTGVEIRAERGKPVEVTRFGPDQEAIKLWLEKGK